MIKPSTEEAILAITKLESSLCNLVNGYRDTPELPKELEKKWLDNMIDEITKNYEECHKHKILFSDYESERLGLKDQLFVKFEEDLTIEEKAVLVNTHDTLEPAHKEIFLRKNKISKGQLDAFRTEVARGRHRRASMGYKIYG